MDIEQHIWEGLAAFCDGKLSYSKVRAVSWVATVDSDSEPCGLGLAVTAGSLRAVRPPALKSPAEDTPPSSTKPIKSANQYGMFCVQVIEAQ